MKKILIFLLVLCIGLSMPIMPVSATEIEGAVQADDSFGLTAPSAILMEASGAGASVRIGNPDGGFHRYSDSGEKFP